MAMTMVLEPPWTLPDPPAFYDTAPPPTRTTSTYLKSEEATKISGFLTPLRSCYDVKIRCDSVTTPLRSCNGRYRILEIVIGFEDEGNEQNSSDCEWVLKMKE
ncbi:hypothetical protein Acr_15g0001300 [Actinidia rufa]|uniref:Uncharacterized protein n=1 Tax=Actinidia rufa TaxID=165716 RepID=A0A7J0FS83_9ERIC|nr:hypothetical protein Acr_15g0001300 [Actinidia rufa]